MVSLAIARSGATTSGTKSVLRLPDLKLSLSHFSPSTPAVIDPPDTLEIRFIVPSRSAS